MEQQDIIIDLTEDLGQELEFFPYDLWKYEEKKIEELTKDIHKLTEDIENIDFTIEESIVS